MIYKIIVDKQPMNNPSAEKKEYEIDIAPLYYKDDIYDSLVITQNEDYVMRRLELTGYNVLVELDPPVKEPLQDINIELFEGDNYIYLYDMAGNKIIAQYLVKNQFNETYVIYSEMNSAIKQSADAIELSVSAEIQRVDEDISELQGQVVEITTDFVKFTDLSTPNQYTTIAGDNITTGVIKSNNYDPDNVTAGMCINLTNGTIDTKNTKWDSQGNLAFSGGAQIINANGLLTNLQFVGTIKDAFNIFGINANIESSEYYSSTIVINVSIPTNFVVKRAYITLVEQPVYWGNIPAWGYPRQIAVFKEDNNPLIDMDYEGDMDYSYIPMTQLTAIFNNDNTWTPTAPSNNSHNTQIKETNNISNSYFEAGTTSKFLIRSLDIPSGSPGFDYRSITAPRTGLLAAYLNVIGYYKETI